MTIGDRHIRGIIRDRVEAEQVYQEARAQGYVASLLTQERANIFTQKVANIEPGKSIDVSITYFGPLAYSDGAFEFVFPMVVGPRFNPPGTIDGVGAVARGGAGTSGQPTEVQYLKPNERSGHDVSVTVDIDAGLPIARIDSVNHAVEARMQGETGATVTLSRHDTLPNKDFVLRVHVAGDALRSTLLTMADERDAASGYFNLLLVPPQSLTTVPRGPVEMVFVLDCSGSMNGRPVEQAKQAIERGLARMQPGDSFQLINFSNSAGQLSDRTLDATPANIRRARDYLARLNGEGGTHMVEGIRAALAFPGDDLRPRHVAFLTDGFIGNEDDVLRTLYAGLGASRVFSFGVGSAPNRALMDSMARMGRGAAAYLSLNDSSGAVMDDYFDTISHAAMTHVTIDSDGALRDVFPSRVPDVFVGRPVVIVGRYDGTPPTSLTVRGRCGGKDVSVVAHAARAESTLARRAVPRVWARAKLIELAEAAVIHDQPALAAESRQTALDYSLMSAFTAFLAVDSSQRTAGTHGTTVAVPVPVPQGVRYDTTVSESR
jgi:Ca-activated chloride channel family protein